MLCLSGFELYSRWVPLLGATYVTFKCTVIRKAQTRGENKYDIIHWGNFIPFEWITLNKFTCLA